MSEDCNAITSYFEGFDNVDFAHFIGHGGAETSERCGADNAAKAAKFEFGEDFDNEDAEAVEVVEGEFTDCTAGDDDSEAGVMEFFDGGFELRFFTLCEIHHFFCVV